MQQVVLISGKQGSGKSTTSKDLVEALWASSNMIAAAKQFRFAAPLYEMHDAVLAILKRYGIERPELAKDGPLLQLLGTEWGRKTVDEMIWVKCCQNAISHWFGSNSVPNMFAVVDDCRFINEFHAFPEAFKVRLECDREIRKSRCSMWRENDTHDSEINLDGYSAEGKFDLVINTGNTDKGVVAELILQKLLEAKK